jgi:ribosome-binding protein aMBF1 (putative translation factor)
MLEILEQVSEAVRELDMDAAPPPRLKEWMGLVAGRIREARKGAGLTQEELAERTGLPQSHISRLERGEHSPSHLTLEKLAKGLQVPLSRLDPTAE